MATHIASTQFRRNQRDQGFKSSLLPHNTQPRQNLISKLTLEIHTNVKMNNKKDSGIAGAGKTVTSTLGNTVGGLSNTVGGVVGAASRGIGETVNGATGGVGRPLGDGIANIGTGLEGGVASVSQGIKDAGEWKTNSGVRR